MNIKAWSTALLILCLCPAAMAQKANRYLEKPLPQGWGRDASHAIPGDDNLFSEQIPPIDDKWWKAFDDPMLDSLITVRLPGWEWTTRWWKRPNSCRR